MKSLGIVIPLKSEKICSDWLATCHLLNSTLDSIRNQTSCLQKTVVVCDEIPVLSEANLKSTSILQLPGEIKSGREFRKPDAIIDKTLKLTYGLKTLMDAGMDYCMVMDADDLLHKDLVEFVSKHELANGFVIKDGYEYYSRHHKLVHRTDLDMMCGSTTIIQREFIVIPESIDESTIWSNTWGKYSYSQMVSYFEGISRPLVEIPFPALIYRLDHGGGNLSNEKGNGRNGLKYHCKKAIKIGLLGRSPSEMQKQNFSL